MLNKILKGLGITITTLLMLVSCSKKSNNNIVIYSCAEDYRNEFYLEELKKQFPEYNFTLDYQSSGSAAAKLMAEGHSTAGDILLSWDFTYLEMLTDYKYQLIDKAIKMYPILEEYLKQ